MAKVEHLIVDSAGFIKNANIKEIGDKIYTVNEVVSEIRDKATRRRLAVLPYELKFQQPQPKSIEKIHEISKVTTDFDRLSSTDIKVLALTYELAVKFGGESALKEVEKDKDSILMGGGAQSEPNLLPGFYVPKDDDKNDSEQISAEDTEEIPLEESVDRCSINIVDGNNEEEESNNDQEENNNKEVQSKDEIAEDNDEHNNINKEQDADDEYNDDDDSGWITPSNIHSTQPDTVEKCAVACLTTDFAMQNVLKKIGIEVVSVDGMVIKQVSTFVLRCYACFKITQVMSKKFCPKCGNQTLKRVPVTIEPDGTTKYYLSRNPKVMNTRGKKFSLPMPRGGKHSNNPILCEDQPMPQNRPSKKSLIKTQVWSEDYNVDESPFAVKDTQSRSFRLGIRSGTQNRRQRNPNQNRGKYSRKRN